MKEILRLEWKRDPQGYQIEKREDEPARDHGTFLAGLVRARADTFIVPVSGRLEAYTVEDTGKYPSVELVNVRTSVDMLKFANRWGLPNGHCEAEASAFMGAVNKLWIPWFAHHHGYYDQFSLPACYVPPVVEKLAPDGTIVRIPRDLEAFCWYESMDHIRVRRRFRCCDFCGKLFVGTQTGKRQGEQMPRFCTDTCRKKSHEKGMDGARAQDTETLLARSGAAPPIR